VDERERTLGAAGLALIGIAVGHGWLRSDGFEVELPAVLAYLGTVELPSERACVESALGLMSTGRVVNERGVDLEWDGDMPVLVRLMHRAYAELALLAGAAPDR
jgi:hypothetical protein